MAQAIEPTEKAVLERLIRIGEVLQVPVSTFNDAREYKDNSPETSLNVPEEAAKLEGRIDGAADSPLIRRILDALKGSG